MRTSRLAAVLCSVLAAGCVHRAGDAPPALHVTVVDATGALGTEWGEWSGEAGDRLVVGPTLLRIAAERARVASVTFSSDDFAGVDDPSWRVPIAANLEFASWHVAPAAACGAPAGEWRAPSEPRTASVELSGAADLCLAYRILELPPLLRAQRYRAAYTVIP